MFLLLRGRLRAIQRGVRINEGNVLATKAEAVVRAHCTENGWV